MPASKPVPPSPIRQLLEQIHARFASLDTGQVATYIPELAKANPAWFGIVVATVDGQVYEVGDTRQLFTLQSVSKPLVYGVALEDCGREGVERVVGVEPSGDAFNSISLEPGTGRPRNPMINAGAIAVASLVQGATHADRLQRVVDAVSAYAGRRLDIDATVYESERSTGHRNRAIGHMLRNHDIIRDDPEPALSLYFKQCSLLVDGRDLALMAATLANGGVNPVTQQRAVAREHIDAILSVMTTCGMYDFSGEWVYRVGLPAKSGVGGGILAVLPGQLGIGVFSPLLDDRGNSARGVRVCEALSRELGLHCLQPPRPASSSVRARYDLTQVRSRRQRLATQSRILAEHGQATRVYELQGDLRFATLEPVLRDIVDAGAPTAGGPGSSVVPTPLRHAVLDFARVTHVDAAALGLLERLADTCAARGQHLVLTRVRRGELMGAFGQGMDPRSARAVSFQPQLDFGLEWCERQLLAEHGVAPSPVATGPVPAVDLAAHSLCDRLDPADLRWLDSQLDTLQAEAGTLIVAKGDAADRLYFLMAGEVSVVVGMPQGETRRLTTLGPGIGFGESALLDGGLRSADVRADTHVVCRTLTVEAFERLGEERPRLALALMHNLLRLSAATAARLTGEVAALGASVH